MTGDRLRSSASFLVTGVVVAFVLAAVSLVVQLPWSASAHRPHVDLTRLTAATTGTTLRHAPRDTHRQATTSGEVVHPLRLQPVYAEPGRRPFAKVGQHEVGETWLPVVARRGAWSQVLLPSRPNGTTGWLRTSEVERRTTPYLVRVHLASRELQLYLGRTLTGSWPVAVGRPETPTPVGRTFVLGSITDRNQAYSPVILPLGAHSDTLDSYGGGPGTVALHTWPDASVFGTAASHGCIRVPADALDKLTRVPLGTLVVVDDK
jgi:lipoprotein-anchoring transpeptidase ErfK/SrfK